MLRAFLTHLSVSNKYFFKKFWGQKTQCLKASQRFFIALIDKNNVKKQSVALDSYTGSIENCTHRIVDGVQEMTEKNRGLFEGHQSHFFSMEDVERLPLQLQGDAICMLIEREENWQACHGKNSFEPIGDLGDLKKWVQKKNHSDKFSGGISHGSYRMVWGCDEEAQESLLEGLGELCEEVEEGVDVWRKEEAGEWLEELCDALRESDVEAEHLEKVIPALAGVSVRRKQQVFQQILEDLKELKVVFGDQVKHVQFEGLKERVKCKVAACVTGDLFEKEAV